ncbi:hypothetical protein HY487_01300 [Candidatus Woesearchaeota archaeon]|nr:hypothetical protein [Candidatus Woesearchaeota archaeon]
MDEASELEQVAKHGFNRGVLPVPVLALPHQKLLHITPDELELLTAQHYAKIRPVSMDLRGRLVLEHDFYDLKYAAAALFMTPQHFPKLASEMKLYMEARKKGRYNKLIGYEIIRLFLKPQDTKTATDETVKTFYVSREIARRLPHGLNMRIFFDKIHPIYGSPRYHLLNRLPENPLLSDMQYATSQK